jgi:hypothetical protein
VAIGVRPTVVALSAGPSDDTLSLSSGRSDGETEDGISWVSAFSDLSLAMVSEMIYRKGLSGTSTVWKRSLWEESW